MAQVSARRSPKGGYFMNPAEISGLGSFDRITGQNGDALSSIRLYDLMFLHADRERPCPLLPVFLDALGVPIISRRQRIPLRQQKSL